MSLSGESGDIDVAGAFSIGIIRLLPGSEQEHVSPRVPLVGIDIRSDVQRECLGVPLTSQVHLQAVSGSPVVDRGEFLLRDRGRPDSEPPRG